MTTHVMTDLETLGTVPGCKILSIGAVVMSAEGLGERFYTEIARSKQDRLVEDPETIAWWEKQDPAVRDRLFNSETKPSLEEALGEFNIWLTKVSEPDSKGKPDLNVWGNGAAFDNAILNFAYATIDMKPAWPFFGDKCYRTIKGMYPHIKADRVGNLHNALDDAITQANHMVELNRVLLQRGAAPVI